MCDLEVAHPKHNFLLPNGVVTSNSHLVDSMKHTGIDARNPAFASEASKQDWTRRDSPTTPPEHSPEHWDRLGQQIRVKGKEAKRPAGALMSFMLANNKFKNMAKYHKLHEQLTDLVNRHRADARGAVAELMEHKAKAGLHDAARVRNALAGKPDSGEYPGPVVAGLAPKTARYTLGMMGGGNVQVPDTHFTRYLFGLEKGRDNETIDKIKSVLWNENNTHVLDAIDRYYAANHDAVKHMVSHPKYKHLFANAEEAVFPAFWKNWVGIVPHERARGMGTGGANESTDHRPFWEAVEPFLKAEGAEDFDESLPARTATLHNAWVREHGEVPALTMYYAMLVPKLLARHHALEARSGLLKAQALVVDLKKAVAEAKEDAPAIGDYDFQDHPVEFAGNHVIPGTALSATRKYALLHEDENHYYAVPHDKVFSGWEHTDLVKLSKSRRGTHFWVTARPARVYQEEK
jgi:hypothetical protein